MSSNTASSRQRAISRLLSTKQALLINSLYYRYAVAGDHATLTSLAVEDAVSKGFAVASFTASWDPTSHNSLALVATVAHRDLRKHLKSDGGRYCAPKSEQHDWASHATNHDVADSADMDMHLLLIDVLTDLTMEELILVLNLDGRNRTNADHTAIHRIRTRLRANHGSPFCQQPRR